jgi:serine/threonine protein kinase
VSLEIGSQLGSCEIMALLGKGGMGEVYRARDSKLKRDVAIKILSDEFSRDPDRLRRFQREAEALASLNHPNIAAIYDLQETRSARYLILELVEGQTLADRIARGPLKLDEDLTIAKCICEALQAAHEKGIIHRDVKPANIKITPEGITKVLDFGLAKVPEPERFGLESSNSPTMLTAMRGFVFGTPAYMSPEQACGKDTDRTSDIWAFGCVFYEMLTGHRVFEGESAAEILSGIFKADPDWRRLAPGTPESIRRLLRRCLQKEPKQRLQDIGDARPEIEEAQSPALMDGSVAQANSGRWKRVTWVAALALLVFIGGLASAVTLLHHSANDASRIRYLISLPEKSTFSLSDEVRWHNLSISPNGRNLAFIAVSEGRQLLWLRPADSLSARALPGTDGAFSPVWSPDSRWLAFFAEGKLKKIDPSGGPPEVLCDLPDGTFVGTWGRKGIILVNHKGNDFSGLYSIPEIGGVPTLVMKLGEESRAWMWPTFLPDGPLSLFRGQRASRRQRHLPRIRRLRDAETSDTGPVARGVRAWILALRTRRKFVCARFRR